MTNNSRVSPLSNYSHAATRKRMYTGMATNYVKIHCTCTGRLK